MLFIRKISKQLVIFSILLLLTLLKVSVNAKQDIQLLNEREASTVIEFDGFEFQNHEHPYFLIDDTEYDQLEGDKVCLNRWRDLPTVKINHESNTSLPYRSSFDGINIYNQWHIWYHRSAGICVANK